MPFFDVKLLNTSTNTIIKGETVADLITEAERKLGLPQNPEDYRMVLEDGHADIDKDVLELATYNLAKPLKSIILLKDDTLRHEPQHNGLEDANNATTASRPGTLISHFEVECLTWNSSVIMAEHEFQCFHLFPVSSVYLLDPFATIEIIGIFILSLGEQTCSSDISTSLIEAICQDTLKKCQDGEELETNEFLSIKKNIQAHLFKTKDTSRKKALKIVTALCTKFPDSLAIRGKAKTLDEGIMSLLTSVENGIQYSKSTLKLPKNSRKRRAPAESVENEGTEVQRQRDYFHRIDEFGFVEYLPKLPSDENEETQNDARVELESLFNDVKSHSSDRVSILMKKTYPTQRVLITAPDRNINGILTSWPFLKIPQQFFQHASTLVGKDVVEIWNSLLLTNGEPILGFMTMKMTGKKEKEKLKSIMEEKDQGIAREQKMTPQYSAIFPLLLLAFNENSSCLFKLIKGDPTVEEWNSKIDTTNPILIVEGSDIHDGNAKYTVIIDAESRIICDDFLDGVLITFLSYFVFGYKYRPEIANTLAYIQKNFLAIVPSDGTKSTKKSSRGGKFSAAVVKLSDQVKAYSDNFSMAKVKEKKTEHVKEKISSQTSAK
ncbi:hypothetical protein QAD02_002825 [Eretmocerus hayati]|uniref:Uncharacterized protein n=1 Tax=Eretmocerus hayati TaxID=131215 RepID=A0ACC2NKY8_9HYME|nr:hypothetical protein QAD02_002825 [Eretmocerus hayati]